jgi:hypothetical protein
VALERLARQLYKRTTLLSAGLERRPRLVEQQV